MGEVEEAVPMEQDVESAAAAAPGATPANAAGAGDADGGGRDGEACERPRRPSEPRSEAEPQHLLMRRPAHLLTLGARPPSFPTGAQKASGACAACGAEAVLWGAAKRRPSAEEADFRAPRPQLSRNFARAPRGPTFL